MGPQRPRGARVLYLSFDGLLQPLGYSQVARPLLRLASLGFAYDVVSLERASDLSASARVSALEAQLSDVGIRWYRGIYDEAGGAKAAANNVRAVFGLANGTLSERSANPDERPCLVHARGYQSAAVATALRALHGLPYIFDARGYWVDEVADEGRWFHRPAAYRVGKAAERLLYHRAAAVVTLTDLQRQDLRSQGWVSPSVPVEVVTTLADFDEFSRGARGGLTAEERAWLERHQVIAFVGSVNKSYRTEEALDLAARVLSHNREAALLILTGQPQTFAPLLDAYAIPRERVLCTSVPHEAIPSWLAHVDWGLLLLNETFAKRASMPTKLGEFFASGVRPLHYGCNPEVAHWVRVTGSGISLPALDAATLEQTAAIVSQADTTAELLTAARSRAAAHYSLDAGIARYENLLSTLGVPRRRSAAATPQASHEPKPSASTNA